MQEKDCSVRNAYLLDKDGYIIEVYAVEEGEERPGNADFLPPPELSFYRPRWDREAEMWTEGEAQDVIDAQQEKARLIREASEAEKYLISTDWYLMRKLETGKEIPQDVVVARQEARKKVDMAKNVGAYVPEQKKGELAYERTKA